MGCLADELGKGAVRLMALSAIGGAFVGSVATLLALLAHDGQRLTWTAWRWFSIAGRHQQAIPIDVAFGVDALGATFMLVITGVGFLIHVYATGYMRTDAGFHRFFAYLNLFCFAMLVLVMADNLLVLFVGWEGVGLCSYLLIGFWFEDIKNASAGKKAFIVNRIGDFGLLVAMALLVYFTGHLRFSGIEANVAGLMAPVKLWPVGNLSRDTLPHFLAYILVPSKPVMAYAATLVGLAVFLGCAGKSAQIPLYVWLPDAMAGPTPVSALIHAATMVTAGVYLVARLSFVFVMSPVAMATVAVVGVATALFAASIGLFQTDIKKVLAYSTVSQLGFMFIGVGVGAFASGVFHVVTHAFFKACLFLCAGSVIHAMHARIHDSDKAQDMRNMGGLARYLPVTRWTFLISCLAISGVPPLAGFWSKDAILWQAFSRHVAANAGGSLTPWQWPEWLGPTIYWGGIVAATMTAFYMFRAYFMTFHGELRGWKIVEDHRGRRRVQSPHAPHAPHEGAVLEGPAPRESPLSMTVPLVILAAFAALSGLLNAEAIHITPLGRFLEPVFASANERMTTRAGAAGLEWAMMAPGLLAFAAGAGAAVSIYLQHHGEPERRFAKRFPGLYGLIYDKWRIDELYDAVVVGMVDALADILVVADTWIIDGLLARASSAVVAFLGTVLRAFQTGRVHAYSAAMMVGLTAVAWFLVRPHAEVSIDDAALRQDGRVVLSAAPGLGYDYHWTVPGMAPDSRLASSREITVTLQPGETKEVVLEIENAFRNKTHTKVPLRRPTPSKRTSIIEVGGAK